ncbi:hypothetical protein [Nocardia sp. XZ_19_385]|uniref:hypothetical protein n=1 Tax=Nocardia sp. XZ_19_385 TaxID=2769488 RepID=UPI0018900792|nr:hypothetical protein [Nocardia sp. XZ_19_385]
MSEMDDIGRDTSRTLREVITTARGWIQAHRHRNNYTGVRKLTRREKRDLAEALRIQVGEQRIAAAWFTKRVSDYQHEANAVQSRMRHGADPEWVAAQQQRLSGIRYGIESTVHNTALRLEHRGQVVQALNILERHPHVEVDNLFPPINAHDALTARAAAVDSERRIHLQRDRNDRVLAEQRVAAERRANPEVLRAENTELRRRISELEMHSPDTTQPDPPARGFVWDRFHSSISYFPEGEPGARTLYGAHDTESDIASWTQSQLEKIQASPGTTVRVRVKDLDRGGAEDPVLSVDGPANMAADEVRDWYRGTIARPDREHPSAAAQQRGPGRDSRAVDLEGAQGVPARSVKPTVDSGEDRLAQIERHLSDITADRDQLESRVGMLQRGLDSVTADRDEMKRLLAVANGRIDELKNRNLRMANEIGELRDRPNVDQVAAERDRYKRERDEAVAKLVRATPERQRYGNRAGAPTGSGQPGTPQQKSPEAPSEALRDWNKLVGQNMAEALDNVADVPPIAKRQLGDVDWQRFTNGGDHADEVARWWANGGAEKYWAEHEAREKSGQPIYASEPETTQPWRSQDVHEATNDKPAPDRPQRNGRERSR